MSRTTAAPPINLTAICGWQWGVAELYMKTGAWVFSARGAHRRACVKRTGAVSGKHAARADCAAESVDIAVKAEGRQCDRGQRRGGSYLLL